VKVVQLLGEKGNRFYKPKKATKVDDCTATIVASRLLEGNGNLNIGRRS